MHASPYPLLAFAYQTAADIFLNKPSHELYEQWLIYGNPTLDRRRSPNDRLAAAKEILRDAKTLAAQSITLLSDSATPQETITWQYSLTVGEALFCAAEEIALQKMSEKLHTPPPPLSPFAKRVQLATYRQLELFVAELESDTGLTSLATTLDEEIALFSNSAPPETYANAQRICDELQRYYQQS